MAIPVAVKDRVALEALRDEERLKAEALDPDIQWDQPGTLDWKDCIGEHAKAIWATFTDEQKLALAMDADAEDRRAWAEMD